MPQATIRPRRLFGCKKNQKPPMPRINIVIPMAVAVFAGRAGFLARFV